MLEIITYNVDELISTQKFSQTLSLMPKQRQDKVLAYHFDKDQRLALGAGFLLHNWLQKHSISFKDVKIALSPYGKESFLDYPNWHYSLSHAGHYAVLAIANRPIGVDIEEVKSFDKFIFQNLKAYYTKEEIEQIEICNNEEQKAKLCARFWTWKESYMKALGLGFNLILQSFAVQINDAKQGSFLYPENAKAYSLHTFKAPLGYVLSYCIKN